MRATLRTPRRLLLLQAFLAAAIVAFLFGGYELIERTWLSSADPRKIHLLHIIRGIVSTLLGGSAVAWYLTKSETMSVLERMEPLREMEIADQKTSWLIRMRWLAVVGITTVIACARSLGILDPATFVPLWLGVGALFIFNGWLIWMRTRGGLSMASLTFQLAADSSLLAYLLHFSGGIENPFFLLYLFHAQVAAVLLPSRDAMKLVLWSASLLLFSTFGEYSGALTHHPLLFSHHAAGTSCLAQSLAFLGPLLVAFVLVQAGTTLFTVSIMDRLRSDNEHILASERLSALGRIIGFVAHEINNPIAIISTKAHLALSKSHMLKDTERVRGMIEIFARQADRIGSLIRSLLSVTYPSSDTKDEVRISDILDEVLARLEHRFRACGIKLDRESQAQAVLRNVRFSEIVQIFSSLLLNALEATPRGGSVKVVARGSPGWLEVSIVDNGCGIRPEDMPRIFEPFFTTKPVRGSGLGLALCNTLVKAYGGEISASSRPGQGSEFSIRFPAALPRAAEGSRGGTGPRPEGKT